MKSKKIILFAIVLCFSFIAQSKDAPFHRGINLTEWFQASSVEQIQFTKYTRTDFKQIKSLGIDVVRLPLNLHFMTNGAPDYAISPRFFAMLDSAVTWAEKEEIYLILDNHTFDPAVPTSSSVGTILNKVWPQMAARYKNRSKYICYEILNEPHGITASLWGNIQKAAIDAIRTQDSTHIVVVGGTDWNSYNTLGLLPKYADTNLVYTFHFYDPMLFTHQGASWVDPSMDSVRNIPFPYSSTLMPTPAAKYKGTWIESNYKDYATLSSITTLTSNLSKALQFAKDRNVPIFCGEYGVYIPNSDKQSRVNWYDSVHTMLEKNKIAWTLWDYHGGFGLYNTANGGLFEHDLNVDLLKALQFTVPAQTPFIIKPDTAGMIIYDDYVGKYINQWATGSEVSFMSDEMPNNGASCIRWGNVPRYNNLIFNFEPNKDFTFLKNNGYALDFMYRSNSSASSFEVRFLDTKIKDSTDRPWRMSYSINSVSNDAVWHHAHIPLNQFAETGSYDGNWMTPNGLFDWTKIDRFEIVAEQSAIDKFIWFDNIIITNKDTAKIYETNSLPQVALADQQEIPAKGFYAQTEKTIVVQNQSNHACRIVVYDLLGQIVLSQSIKSSCSLPFHANAGIFLLQITDNEAKTSNITKLEVW